MSKIRVKNIIAREGLILIGLVILGLIVYFSGRYLNNLYLIEHQQAKFKIIHNMRYSLDGHELYLKIMTFGFYFAVFSYPVFALGRFIVWAIRTIEKK